MGQIDDFFTVLAQSWTFLCYARFIRVTLRHSLEFISIEFLDFRGNLIHVLLDKIGTDVGGTGDDEEFLVSGVGGFRKGFLRHIAAVGDFACDDEEGLLYEVGMVVRVGPSSPKVCANVLITVKSVAIKITNFFILIVI